MSRTLRVPCVLLCSTLVGHAAPLQRPAALFDFQSAFCVCLHKNMFDRAYRGMRPAITTHWRALLAGELSRAEATERILRDLPSPVAT